MSLRLAQGVSLVTANTRLARHLRWHADRQQAATGDFAWPSVDILPWSAWLQRLWRDSLVAGGEAGQFDLLTDQQARLIWQNITAKSPVPELAGTHDFAAATTLLINAWRLSHSWDIPVPVIRRSATGPDAEAFAAWAAKYDRLCRERKWVDSAMVPDLLRQELSSGRITLTQPVAFVGFDRSTPQQNRMWQTLDDLGQLRPPPVNDVREPQHNAVVCADQQHEFELAARWSRRLADDQKAAVIGVVIPERAAGSARRIFLDVMCPGWRSGFSADFPVNVNSGQSLSDIGVIHIALLLLALTKGSLNYRKLGQLLRSPYIEGWEDEAMQRATLDVRLRERALQQIDLHQLSAQVADADNISERAPRFIELLSRAALWGSRLRGHHEPGHWAGEITSLLQDLGWAKGRSLNLEEQTAADAWVRLLDGFAACSPVIGSISFPEVRGLLSRMAAEQPFQPEGRMDGVQIITAREVSGHHFDGLWICGLSSDVWPPVPITNPLIPIFLQRERGIPEASPQGSRKAAEHAMSNLLTSAPVVMASWPCRREQENLVASPVLDALPRIDAQTIQRYVGSSYREQIFASRKIEVLNHDPPPPLQPTEKVRGGSYLLKMQSACPARAFFEARLGAVELQVPPYGLNALTRGNIIHDALASLYARIIANGALSALTDEQAESWIDISIDRSLRKYLPARHPLAQTLGQTEQRRVKDLLQKMILLDRLRPDFRPEAVECSDTVEFGPLTLSLRQDRIDGIGDGGRLFIDYKTGQGISPGAWRGARPVEPQLPLYAATAVADGIAVVVLNQDGVRLSGVGREELDIDGLQSPEKFLGDPTAAWEGLLAEWKDNLGALAQEFAGGDCRINRLDTNLADGGFAMLTRIHDRSVMDIFEAGE